TFRYDADAQDPDGDALTFSLLSAPNGMTIDSSTGEISRVTGVADLGTQAITVRVTDGHGGSADQQFALTIDTDVPDRPPIFTSIPVVDGEVGVQYSYTVKAFDADGKRSVLLPDRDRPTSRRRAHGPGHRRCHLAIFAAPVLRCR